MAALTPVVGRVKLCDKGAMMRAATCALAIFALTAACATTKPSAGAKATIAAASERSQIEAATTAWNKAIIGKDSATLRTIMAPEFTLTRDDSQDALPRDPWLQNLQKMTLSRYEARVVEVQTYGKIAIARVEGGWDVTMNGMRRNKSFVLADFWVHRDGRWQVFRRHTID